MGASIDYRDKASEPAEATRLEEARSGAAPWKKWGPYLTERQWGTVREDYSSNGDAWNFFTHDQARSRAYRWGEDGIGGISDDNQVLCFALALWNGKDPILKERYFGLTNSEGNHGEDVKEYYFYLDNTPTHSYMKLLYKYPQQAYPYEDIVNTNKMRDRKAMEYELLDTGIFDEDRYFDIFIEYAKAGPDDLLIRITANNRGPDAAELHVLPTLWFRNNWSKWISETNRIEEKPSLSRAITSPGTSGILAHHPNTDEYILIHEHDVPWLFTENETNHEKLFPGQKNESPFCKDGINDFIVHGAQHAVNPDMEGTKAAADCYVNVAAGKSEVIRLRFSKRTGTISGDPFGKAFDDMFATRIREADEFYKSVTPGKVNEDEASVMRQAIAGMLWSKQFYFFDGYSWLNEHQSNPMHRGYKISRNSDWFHMLNRDIISMPDKWEYPWFAAWDLAFHVLPLSIVDIDFAKRQVLMMLEGLYLHPNGQIPAYEWNFSDVNPPVHAWATLFLHRAEKALHGRSDINFLKSVFTKLLLNFTWWVNQKDRSGNNIFQGGFLGLDNIGVFDRSAPLPTGGYLEQADGTAWMGLFTQNMVEIAVELAMNDPAYEDTVVKFVEHFSFIAMGMNKKGSDGMWDEEDGFYYDVLKMPDGSSTKLKVRSLVGLLPICAVSVIEKEQREKIPQAMAAIYTRIAHMPEMLESVHATGPGHFGVNERGILAFVNEDRLRRILSKLLDENEFLGEHGIRSISKYHKDHPYIFNVHGQEYRVDYLPAESDTGMFGGNSNWRGPVWMPVNAMIIRAMLHYFAFYGDSFKIECPTGSGNMMNLYEVAHELTRRLTSIFLRDKDGKRPVYGGTEKFQTDKNWSDNLLFFEYFHGDNGAGLGANHQTGWTGVIAFLIQMFGQMDAESLLATGRKSMYAETAEKVVEENAVHAEA